MPCSCNQSARAALFRQQQQIPDDMTGILDVNSHGCRQPTIGSAPALLPEQTFPMMMRLENLIICSYNVSLHRVLHFVGHSARVAFQPNLKQSMRAQPSGEHRHLKKPRSTDWTFNVMLHNWSTPYCHAVMLCATMR